MKYTDRKWDKIYKVYSFKHMKRILIVYLNYFLRLIHSFIESHHHFTMVYRDLTENKRDICQTHHIHDIWS